MIVENGVLGKHAIASRVKLRNVGKPARAWRFVTCVAVLAVVFCECFSHIQRCGIRHAEQTGSVIRELVRDGMKLFRFMFSQEHMHGFTDFSDLFGEMNARYFKGSFFWWINACKHPLETLQRFRLIFALHDYPFSRLSFGCFALARGSRAVRTYIRESIPYGFLKVDMKPISDSHEPGKCDNQIFITFPFIIFPDALDGAHGKAFHVREEI